ncbi:MAG: AbrB/MazE/SpoVT family DNA-binding domain-containing protein [Thermoflexales bacterium]
MTTTVMQSSRIGRRGQLVLPRDVRLLLHLSEGDSVLFVRRGDEVVLKPITMTALDLEGSIPVDLPQDFNAIRKTVMEERGKETARRGR